LPTTSGLHIVRRKRAAGDRWYVYAKRGGPLIHSTDGDRPAVTDALRAKARDALADTGHQRDDTLSGLLVRYRASPNFGAKAPATQTEYRQRLDQIEARFGRVPLRLIPKLRGEAIKWRDEMAATPRAADRCIGMLATVLAWAEDRELIERNPLTRIGKLHRANRADLIWEPHHWEAVAALDKKGNPVVPGHVRRVLTLGALTGLRRGDLLRLAWEDLQPGYIALRTRKTGGEAIIPLYPDLARFFTGPGRGPVLRNSRGDPWTIEGWKSAWERAEPLGFDRHIHDLRGTFATRLMTAGFTDTEIALVMGWRAERIAAIRMRYIDRSRVARALAERFVNGSVNGLQKEEKTVPTEGLEPPAP
jgi:integrase